MKPRRAFTLIELLVVIAILAILAAILFPVFGKSAQKGKALTSMHNLELWGSALHSSLADSDNLLPFDGGNSGSASVADPTAWYNVLPPYIKEKPLNHPDYQTKPPKPGDKSVWINPAVPKAAGDTYAVPPASFLFCYAMNSYLATSDETGPHRMKLNIIQNQAATVFMSEKADDKPALEPSQIQAYFGDGDPVADPNGLTHFLYCDGHIELRKRSNFDPTLMPGSVDDPNPISTTALNRNFTYLPYLGAKL